MGYNYSGVCYGDTAAALAAFRSEFPRASGTILTNLNSSSINATGLITYVATTQTITSATKTTGASVTVQLPTCTTEMLGQYPIQNIVFVVALLVLWALGFQSGLHR